MNKDIYFEPDNLCSTCQCDHDSNDHEACATNLKQDLNEAFREITQLKTQLKAERDVVDFYANNTPKHKELGEFLSEEFASHPDVGFMVTDKRARTQQKKRTT